MCKQKVVCAFLLEAWSVHTGKYKTELWGGTEEEGEKESEKNEAIWFCLLNRQAPVSAYCGNCLGLWLLDMIKFSLH